MRGKTEKNNTSRDYKVSGMTCAACQSAVERAVSALPGVDSCAVNLLTGEMRVVGSADKSAVAEAVRRAGYRVAEEREDERGASPAKRQTLIKLLISISLLLPLSYLAMGHMIGAPIPIALDKNPLATALIEMLLSASVMVINYKFFVGGVRAVIRLSPNMDTLVSLGSLVSFGYSTYCVFAMSASVISGDIAGAVHQLHGLYFEAAAMILTLISLGKLLEERAKGRATDALRRLMSLAPRSAVMISEGVERTVSVEEIGVGDLILIRPGERIPIDGVISEGEGSLDESALTGESIPRDKSVGDAVMAGSVNTTGRLVIRATKVGEGTTLAAIIKTVRDATATKAPIARLADRVSGIFVPIVLGIALTTLAGWLIAGQGVGFALSRAISVVVISCPCALGLATPVAIMVGSGVGARSGILYKSAAALEMAGRINIVALDKTGTVTNGELRLTDIHPVADSRELLSVAYSLERPSEHPIGRALCRELDGRGIILSEVKGFRAIPGSGVYGEIEGDKCYGVNFESAKAQTIIDKKTEDINLSLASQGKTPLYFIREGRLLGIIALADTVKPEARGAVSRLRRMGIRVVMLTGDNRYCAQKIAADAGIDEVMSELLPDEKADAVRSLAARGRVCMVGDGINDAPALASADLGIAIGAGSDIAIDSAGAVLMNNRLDDLVAALRLGRKALINIRENLFWAFLYNCLGIPLAAGLFGLAINPMIGAAAMSLSSVSVVLNALRLGLFKPHGHRAALTGEQPKTNATERKKEKMTKVFKIEGMMCPHCEARVKEVVLAIEGVTNAIPDHKTGSLTVEISGDVPDTLITEKIVGAGYKVV